MTTCGIWPTSRCLLAVVIDDDGRLAENPRKACYSDDARWALLNHIEAQHGLDCAFVVTRSFARMDPIAQLASRRGARVIVVADQFVHDLCVLIAPTAVSARQLALLLARLPICPIARPQLSVMQPELPLIATP